MHQLTGRRSGAGTGRTPTRALFRRIVPINGLGTLVLALSPATVSSPVLLTEIPVLTIGLVVILAANTVLLRAAWHRSTR